MSCSYLPTGQLGVLGCGAAVITFELVLGLFEEGVQAFLQAGPVPSLAGLFTCEVLQASRQQRLLYIRVPAAIHLLWDLWERRSKRMMRVRPYLYTLFLWAMRTWGVRQLNVRKLQWELNKLKLP